MVAEKKGEGRNKKTRKCGEEKEAKKVSDGRKRRMDGRPKTTVDEEVRREEKEGRERLMDGGKMRE